MQELLEEIHEGDPRMGTSWPWHYSALEPLNKKRQDWRLRYAAAFQLSLSGGTGALPAMRECYSACKLRAALIPAVFREHDAGFEDQR